MFAMCRLSCIWGEAAGSWLCALPVRVLCAACQKWTALALISPVLLRCIKWFKTPRLCRGLFVCNYQARPHAMLNTLRVI